MLPFEDRWHAGRALGASEPLQHYAHRPDVLVLGLPRGGVVVAFEVGRALGACLDVFVVRKLGVPGFEELAMGAIASGGVRVYNRNIIDESGITQDVIDAVAVREETEVRRREQVYRGGQPLPDVGGRSVILVDDGLATGATMKAGVLALRQMSPERVVVAAPLAAPEVRDHMESIADEVVCLATPEPFFGVGRWYERFEQTSDQEVRELLERSRRELHARAG